MIIKMLITFDYNPDTNEYIPLKQEIVKDSKKSTKKETVVEDSGEASLILYDNKYKLTESAIALLNVESGDRISINYQIVDGINFPIIGPDSIWGCSSGNKLTKTNTVSCRGQANELLSKFGSEFNLIPYIKTKGLFTLVPKNGEIEIDSNITLPDNKEEVDLKEEVINQEEFDLDSLEVQEQIDDTNIEDAEIIEDVNFEEYELQDIEFNF